MDHEETVRVEELQPPPLVTTVLLATRSRHKSAEIQQMVPGTAALRIIDLHQAGIPESPGEDDVEAFDTFEENALAKARYFADRTGLPVLSDDSGLCVDALDGAPGVRSKRFSGRSDLTGIALDHANNDRLLAALVGVPPESRTAHYICVLALVTPDQHSDCFYGRVDGLILDQPRGTNGFGYDPLFYLPEIQATFAEVDPGVKNRWSHRSRAVVSALPRLLELAYQ